MLDGYRRRSFSPVEVMHAVLARAELWEPHICALYAPDFEGAREAARRSETRWMRGEPIGALDGVPVTVKENIATAGAPTPLGTAATELAAAGADAPPAARLREAGALLWAKTTMPDYGMLSSGLSSFHALARNPWDVRMNPGGSSAGAGAAGAAGYGPLHIGTDIGGSVRLPAGWCGLFTLKPSNGRVPIDPPYLGRVAGPMTRDVADAALMMGVLARPDARDHMSLPPAAIDWADLDGDMRGLRVGVYTDARCGLPTDPEVAGAVEAAARAFEDAGAHVEPLKPFFTPDMLSGLDRFWRARAWAEISALPTDRRAKILPFIDAWAESAAGFTGTDVYRHFSQYFATREATAAATEPFDLVLTPTSPVPSYPAEWPCPTNDAARPLDHIAFTVPFNMSEQPAASINCGYTAGGLPIGMQIVGRRFDDLGVLRAARAYEQLRGAQRPWPEPPA